MEPPCLNLEIQFKYWGLGKRVKMLLLVGEDADQLCLLYLIRWSAYLMIMLNIYIVRIISLFSIRYQTSSVRIWVNLGIIKLNDGAPQKRGCWEGKIKWRRWKTPLITFSTGSQPQENEKFSGVNVQSFKIIRQLRIRR